MKSTTIIMLIVAFMITLALCGYSQAQAIKGLGSIGVGSSIDDARKACPKIRPMNSVEIEYPRIDGPPYTRPFWRTDTIYIKDLAKTGANLQRYFLDCKDIIKDVGYLDIIVTNNRIVYVKYGMTYQRRDAIRAAMQNRSGIENMSHDEMVRDGNVVWIFTSGECALVFDEAAIQRLVKECAEAKKNMDRDVGGLIR